MQVTDGIPANHVWEGVQSLAMDNLSGGPGTADNGAPGLIEMS